MFHVGQKVVCVIGGRKAQGHGTEIVPVDGCVYTIRDIIDHGRAIGIRVAEIKNPPMQYRGGIFAECTFDQNIFRPIAEKKTDTGMAILEEILERESFDERIRQPAW